MLKQACDLLRQGVEPAGCGAVRLNAPAGNLPALTGGERVAQTPAPAAGAAVIIASVVKDGRPLVDTRYQVDADIDKKVTRGNG